jgi:hypothetical protein
LSFGRIVAATQWSQQSSKAARKAVRSAHKEASRAASLTPKSFPSPIISSTRQRPVPLSGKIFFRLPSVNRIIFDRRINHLLKKANTRQLLPEDYNTRGKPRFTTQSSNKASYRSVSGLTGTDSSR